MREEAGKGYALFATAFISLAPACSSEPASEPAATTESAINGGRASTLPTVQIVADNEHGPCSGTSLSDRWVLTTSTCLYAAFGQPTGLVYSAISTSAPISATYWDPGSELVLVRLASSLPLPTYASLGATVASGDTVTCGSDGSGVRVERDFFAQSSNPSRFRLVPDAASDGGFDGAVFDDSDIGAGCFKGTSLVGANSCLSGNCTMTQIATRTAWVYQTMCSVCGETDTCFEGSCRPAVITSCATVCEECALSGMNCITIGKNRCGCI